MSASPSKLGAFALLVVLLCTACAGPSAAARAQARHADAQLLLGEVNKRTANAAAAAVASETKACNAQINEFMGTLSDLESKIAVGLAFSSYSSSVDAIRASSGRLDRANLGGACAAAVAAGNTSLNTYITALRTWSACTSKPGCTTASINGDLQAQWAQAAAQTEAAKTAVDEVGDDVLTPTYRNAVPQAASGVASTVYGATIKLICHEAALAAAAKAPCAQLGTILQGGVDSSELGDLDQAVSDLDVALGLKAAKPS